MSVENYGHPYPMSQMPSEEMLMRILRLNEVMTMTGFKRSSIYKMIDEGRFPRQISLSERAVGWLASEIEDWIKARVAERDQA